MGGNKKRFASDTLYTVPTGTMVCIISCTRLNKKNSSKSDSLVSFMPIIIRKKEKSYLVDSCWLDFLSLFLGYFTCVIYFLLSYVRSRKLDIETVAREFVLWLCAR
jgi:hypothetical protein